MALKFLNDGYFAGKVGIGNLSPGAKLDIKGDTTTWDGMAKIYFTDVSSNSASRNWSVGNGGTDFGALSFIVSNAKNGVPADSTGTAVMSMDGVNKRVGIGTTSPEAKLHTKVGTSGGSPYDSSVGIFAEGATRSIIQMSSTSDAYLMFGDASVNNQAWFGYNHANNQLLLHTGSSITMDGNVGIGTTSPTQKLQVNGRIRIPYNSSNSYYFGQDNGSVGYGSMHPFDNGGNYTFDTNYASSIGSYKFKYNGTEIFRLRNTGAFAFGSGGNDYGVSGQILKSNGNASPTWIDGSAIPGVPAGSGTTNYLARWTPDGDTLGIGVVYDNGTNVGIGTSSVGTYKLNVDGAIRIGVSGTIQPLLSRDSSTGGLIVSSVGNSGDFIFQGTSGSEKFRIKDTGNVGIGVTGPSYKLQVNGTIAPEGNEVNNLGTSTNRFNQFFTKLIYDINDGRGLTNQILTSTGSGGIAWANASTVIGGPYLPLDGGTMTGTNGVVFPDVFKLNLGTGSDLQISHDGFDSYINNINSSLNIRNSQNDGDIYFQSDNGSGGIATYFYLDGSLVNGTSIKGATRFPDSSKIYMGDSADLEIFHDGSNSYIRDNGTGDLRFMASNIKFYDNATAELMAQMIPNGAVELYYNNSKKFETTSTGVSVAGDIQIDSALLSNQENTDVDTGTETVASVAIAIYTAAFFDFVIKKTTNVRSGTVYACHDGTNVEFTETSTQDLGDTSDVTLSVDISGTDMRLRATTTSDDWSIKSLIRAI